TLDDLFNTAVAGFTLAKTDAANAKVTTPLVNSGKIGAGAFGGNAIAAYVLQDLAAMQTGVNLKLWGYTKAESDKATNDVNKILSLYQKTQTVKELLSITHDVLTNTPTPTPTPTPTLVGAQVGTTYLRHKPNGKPVGKPVVTFSFRYDRAMD